MLLPFVFAVMINNVFWRNLSITIVIITVFLSPFIYLCIAGYKGQKLVDRYCNSEYLLPSSLAYIHRAKLRKIYNQLEVQKLLVRYIFTSRNDTKERCDFLVTYQLMGRNLAGKTVHEISFLTSSGVNTIHRNITLTATSQMAKEKNLAVESGKEYHPLK